MVSRKAVATLPPGWKSAGADTYVLADDHARVWTVFRKKPGEGWWYANVNATPVRVPFAAGPKYWAFLSKALKDVTRLAKNPSALAFMRDAQPEGGDRG